jgi:hypothetical protein
MPEEFKEANNLKMTAVKGGLMLSSDLGQLTYFNTTALIQNRQGEQMFNPVDDVTMRVY